MNKIKAFVEKRIVKILMSFYAFAMVIFFAYGIYGSSSEDYVTKTHIQHIDDSPQELIRVKMHSTIVGITKEDNLDIYVTPSDLDSFYRLRDIFTDGFVDTQEVFVLHLSQKICNTEYVEVGDVLYTTLIIDDEFNITIHPSEITAQRLLTCF